MNSKNYISTMAGMICILLLSATPLWAEEGPREIPDAPLSEPGQIYFSSANYQSFIQSDENLGALAQAQSQIGGEAESFGFAAKSDEAKFFIIGALYSEALACLNGAEMKMAADRLQLIEAQFVQLEAPSALYNYINKVRSCVALEKYSKEALSDMLSLFQPFFEAWAQRLSQDKQILFQAGSWLTDMSLTAAASDKELIKQAKPQLDYFTKELERMDAPKGVMNAYQKIGTISEKEEISDKDVKTVIKQVKKIRTILG